MVSGSKLTTLWTARVANNCTKKANGSRTLYIVVRKRKTSFSGHLM